MDAKPDRREAKQFEPPPWEQDRFDELARERMEQQAEADLQRALHESGERVVGEPEAEAVDLGPEDNKTEDQAAATPREVKSDAADQIDQVVLTEMLANLSIEEPSSTGELFKLGVFATIACTALGLMLLVWGAVALAEARRSGQSMIAASVFGSAGMAFVGMGVWIAIRTRNLRGASK